MKLYDHGNPNSDIVLIQPVDTNNMEEIEKEYRGILELCNIDFHMIAAGVDDWNNELSPWEAPAVFGEAGFSGGAAKTLGEILKLCKDKNKTYYIGGYSLAGLFALWSVYQTDVFSGVAAASPSLWFPGFALFMKNNEIKTDTIYLSLGDREEKTRNQVMASVGERIRESYMLLKDKGVNCVLEWNEGNHFKDAELRSAKAFAWVINGISHNQS